MMMKFLRKTMDDLNRPNVEEYKDVSKNKCVVILDNIRSFQNVGSAFRTSDAFAIEELILVGVTPTPPHRDIQKVALGATDSVSWRHFETIEEAILYCNETYACTVIGIEQVYESIPLTEFQVNPNEYSVLIFGNEVFGLSDEALDLCDAVIEIEQYGTKHSLNISVSLGIVLFYFNHNLSD